MNGKQLKNSILQWAIQGKLVPQDPNDEPASVLLEKIRQEKERLIKEKEISGYAIRPVGLRNPLFWAGRSQPGGLAGTSVSYCYLCHASCLACLDWLAAPGQVRLLTGPSDVRTILKEQEPYENRE